MAARMKLRLVERVLSLRAAQSSSESKQKQQRVQEVNLPPSFSLPLQVNSPLLSPVRELHRSEGKSSLQTIATTREGDSGRGEGESYQFRRR